MQDLPRAGAVAQGHGGMVPIFYGVEDGRQPGSTRPRRGDEIMPLKKSKGSISSHGYMLIYVGKDHHLADVRGYAYEHRLVAEKKLGRRLLPGEIIHHVDGDKLNNDPSNIEISPSIAHHKVFHRGSLCRLRHPDEDNPMICCSCGCGAKFLKYDSNGRPRQYLSGHWRKGRKGGWASASK